MVPDERITPGPISGCKQMHGWTDKDINNTISKCFKDLNYILSSCLISRKQLSNGESATGAVQVFHARMQQMEGSLTSPCVSQPETTC